jgi:hypothetical protein
LTGARPVGRLHLIAKTTGLTHISNACGMTYRWSPRSADAPNSLNLEVPRSGDSTSADNIALYCRVDIVRAQDELELRRDVVDFIEPLYQSEIPGDDFDLMEPLPEPKKDMYIWMCSNCGDGPIGIWQPCCTNCNHMKCGSCIMVEMK